MLSKKIQHYNKSYWTGENQPNRIFLVGREKLFKNPSRPPLPSRLSQFKFLPAPKLFQMPHAIIKNDDNDTYTILANQVVKTPGLPFALSVTFEKQVDDTYFKNPPNEIPSDDPKGWTKSDISAIYPNDEDREPLCLWKKNDPDYMYAAGVTDHFCKDLHIEEVPYYYKNLPYLSVREKFVSRILQFMPVPLFFGYMSGEVHLDPSKWVPDTYKLFEIYTVDRECFPKLKTKFVWKRTESFTRFRDGPEFSLTAYGDTKHLHEHTPEELDHIRRSIEREFSKRSEGEQAILTSITEELDEHYFKTGSSVDPCSTPPRPGTKNNPPAAPKKSKKKKKK